MTQFARRLAPAALAALLAAAAPARAEVITFATAGNWEAFGGTDNSGSAVCGVSAEGGGRWFSIKYYKGDDALTVQLGKDTWKVDDGTETTVKMSFDNDIPWAATGKAAHLSNGEGFLQFAIPSSRADEWVNDYRRAQTMDVSFPDQPNIDDWTADLTGTNNIATQMMRCIEAMR